MAVTVSTTEVKTKRARAPKGVPGFTRPMTYREYLESPEEMKRYDILDGKKVYRLYGAEQLPNPTRAHNKIGGKLYVAFQDFEQRTGKAQAILAPCDVLVTRRPLHTRQPDISLIGNERLSKNPPPDNPAPLDPAPELVVEIVSPSDRASVLAAKISDYRSIAVREIWIVRSAERSVEVVALSIAEIVTVATYFAGEDVRSVTFPELTVSVDHIFE